MIAAPPARSALAALAVATLKARQVDGAVAVAEVLAAARLIEFMRGLSR